jgi:NADH-quinone oxidoreductase subunit J
VIEPWLFWIIVAITVIPALALLFARKPVHIAMAVVLVMVGLAVSYVSLDAPFLGVVQIVVYTGAVMMLFLFVLMLVGVDQRENLKETIRGQKWIGLLLAIGVAVMLASVVSRSLFGSVQARPAPSAPEDIAVELFSRYVIVMEALAFVLITAAVGALVLTYVPRLKPRATQKELQAERIAAGANPVNKPMPGVYARHNALDAPALDPQGNPIEDSVSRVLEIRHQTKDGEEYRIAMRRTRRELGIDDGPVDDGRMGDGPDAPDRDGEGRA